MASQADLMYGQSLQPDYSRGATDAAAAGGGGGGMGGAGMGAATGALSMMGPWGMAAAGALQIGGQVAGMLSKAKAKKRAKAREERILEQINTGASTAKGNILATLPSAQGATTQNMISRGLVNSSAASDAAAATSGQIAGQMGAVDQKAAQDKAQVMGDFAEQGGGGGGGGGASLAQSGATIGALLASNLSANEGGTGNRVGGPATAQDAARPAAVDVAGGDPTMTSDAIRGAYDGGGAAPEWAGKPTTETDALSLIKRSRGARGASPRMGGSGTMDRASRLLAMGR